MNVVNGDTLVQAPTYSSQPVYMINDVQGTLSAPVPTAVEALHRKRKHASVSHDPSPSPAPQLLPTLANDEVSPSTRPRLTISRHPAFTPVPNLPNFYNTDLIPSNRVGYRYTPAGLTQPGSTLLQRTIESKPTSARVSWSDRSPFIKVSLDGLSLAGDKGFRSARFNTPLREGKWYFEVKILQGGGDLGDGTISTEPSKGAYVRLGFGRREAPLNGPVGLDGYSYGIRDKTGEKVHISRPKPYSRSFSTGDVVGMYICLPPRRQPDYKDPNDPAHLKRERIAIEFKGQEYFESLEYAQEKEMMDLMEPPQKKRKLGEPHGKHEPGLGSQNVNDAPRSPTKKSATVKNTPSNRKGGGRRAASSVNNPKTIPTRSLLTLDDSYIAFFINGECQGIAFQDLYSYLPLRRHSASETKRNPYQSKEGPREHKPNPFDDGTLGYYPLISLFNEAKVKVNVGPDFDFWPGDDVEEVLGLKPRIDHIETEEERSHEIRKRTWRPLCQRYPEYMAEQWALDEKEEADAAVSINQGYVSSSIPTKPRENNSTKGTAPGGRGKRSGGRSKRVRGGGKKKDISDTRSESVFGERSEGSMTPAVYGLPAEDGEVYSVNTPGAEDDDRFGPGIVAALSIPSPGYAAVYPSSPVAEYAPDQYGGDPSDVEGNEPEFDVGDMGGYYQSEGDEELEMAFEEAAESSRHRP